MFQNHKYMSDLVKRRAEAITEVSGGSGLELRIDDAEMEQILSAGAKDSTNVTNTDK